MLWIQEVEMVNSVEDLKIFVFYSRNYSFSWHGIAGRAGCISPEKIIQNSYFKKKVSLEEQKAQKADRFLRGRQIAYLIYDYFRVTGVNDSVLEYADFFFCCSSERQY